MLVSSTSYILRLGNLRLCANIKKFALDQDSPVLLVDDHLPVDDGGPDPLPGLVEQEVVVPRVAVTQAPERARAEN